MRFKDSSYRRDNSQIYKNVLLVTIVLMAMMFRFWGINFGLPYLYHPDEPGYVSIALKIFKTGNLNPHFFNYPSLFFYLNAFAYVPYFVIGKMVGLFHSLNDIQSPKMLAMGVGLIPLPSTWLLGRGLTAIFGSASVLIMFFIGRELFNNSTAGLLSAVLMAISPTNVTNSHYITPDTFLVFFVLLAFWGSVRIFKYGTTTSYIWAGVASGLVASTKYNGILIITTLVAAHFLRYGMKMKGFKKRNLYIALALSGLTFLLTTPFALFDYKEFLKDLQFEGRHYSTGHAGMEGEPLKYYLKWLWQVEGPISVLSVLEIVRGIYVRSKKILVLSVFPLVYFPFICSFTVRNDRTLMPMTPFLFLLASSLLVVLLKRASSFRANQFLLSGFLIIAVILTFLFTPLTQTVKGDIKFSHKDSREISRIWINQNLPRGSRIAIEAYSPFVDPKLFVVEGTGAMINHPPDWYKKEKFDYLVFGQNMFGRYYNDKGIYYKQIEKYEELFRKFTLVKDFKDGGYEVKIYKVTSQ